MVWGDREAERVFIRGGEEIFEKLEGDLRRYGENLREE